MIIGFRHIVYHNLSLVLILYIQFYLYTLTRYSTINLENGIKVYSLIRTRSDIVQGFLLQLSHFNISFLCHLMLQTHTS